MKKGTLLQSASRSNHHKQHQDMETFTRNHQQNADKLTFIEKC